VTSGMANLIPHIDPRPEQFTLSAEQIAVIEQFIGSQKLRDLGLLL